MRQPMEDLAGGGFDIERHIADAMDAAHWHAHVELNLLLGGWMTYLINGRRERIEPGRLVLFWAAIPHRTIEVEADSPLICAYLPLADFLALPIHAATRRRVMQGDLLRAPEADAGDVAQASRWVAEWAATDAARQQLVTDEVKLRIRRLCLDHARPDTPSRGSARARVRHAERLIELINAHYAEPLSVPRLTALAELPETTAAAAFRATTGLSINEYLIRYRLAQALQRLADTDQPILDIAYECGFGSPSRFYDVFAKRVGEPPQQFRRKLRRDSAA